MKMAIIGGSGAKEMGQGTWSFHAADGVEWMASINPSNDAKTYFIFRHGRKHDKSPAELDSVGLVRKLEELLDHDSPVFLTTATGSLDRDVKLIHEGGFVVVSDLFRGFGYKGQNLLANDEVVHADMSHPFSENAREVLMRAIVNVPNAHMYNKGIYIQNEGNQFETIAEIMDLYCRLDAPRRITEGLNRELTLVDSLADVCGLMQGTQSALKRSLRSELARYGPTLQMSVENAQVGMTALREVALLREAGFTEIGLVSMPVNYAVGFGLATHEVTLDSIGQAKAPFIVPMLQNLVKYAIEAYK